MGGPVAELGPSAKAPGRCGSAQAGGAPPGRGGRAGLHPPRGTYVSVYAVRGRCDNELATVPQVAMAASQISPRSASGLTAY